MSQNDDSNWELEQREERGDSRHRVPRAEQPSPSEGLHSTACMQSADTAGSSLSARVAILVVEVLDRLGWWIPRGQMARTHVAQTAVMWGRTGTNAELGVNDSISTLHA